MASQIIGNLNTLLSQYGEIKVRRERTFVYPSTFLMGNIAGTLDKIVTDENGNLILAVSYGVANPQASSQGGFFKQVEREMQNFFNFTIHDQQGNQAILIAREFDRKVRTFETPKEYSIYDVSENTKLYGAVVKHHGFDKAKLDVTDASGNTVLHSDFGALGKTIVLSDSGGSEVATIVEKRISLADTWHITYSSCDDRLLPISICNIIDELRGGLQNASTIY